MFAICAKPKQEQPDVIIKTVNEDNEPKKKKKKYENRLKSPNINHSTVFMYPTCTCIVVCICLPCSDNDEYIITYLITIELVYYI